jgi:hypothetical protein
MNSVEISNRIEKLQDLIYRVVDAGTNSMIFWRETNVHLSFHIPIENGKPDFSKGCWELDTNIPMYKVNRTNDGYFKANTLEEVFEKCENVWGKMFIEMVDNCVKEFGSYPPVEATV